MSRRLGWAAAVHDAFYPPLCPHCGGASASAMALCPGCTRLLTAVQPPWCQGCGGSLDGVTALCTECLRRDRPWRRATVVFEFDGLARDLVHALKYSRATQLAPLLADSLAAAWRERCADLPLPDCIVPVPLHWWRELRRGYNQSALLAAHLGQQLGVPSVPRALCRTRYTRPQVGLGVEQRLRNLRRAFAVSPRFAFAGKRVLLCDDVLTTGATLQACADRVLAAGAAEVDVITIARG